MRQRITISQQLKKKKKIRFKTIQCFLTASVFFNAEAFFVEVPEKLSS